MKMTSLLDRLCIVSLLLMAIGSTATAQEEEAIKQANALSMAFRSAASKVSPAVVTVVTQMETLRRYEDATGVPRIVSEFSDGSIGSGVIIHENGVVLTNSHVISDADEVLIRMSDNREFKTNDIRRDPYSDVAILRMIDPPKDVPVAKLGNSNKSDIGDWVIAIGSPFELEATVSAGIISGKNRRLEKIRRGKLLQTDAAINPGNSGGPLVNLQGEVIGINTAIASSNGGYQGIGFAIPINNARWVINQLAAHGEVKRSYLGVTVEELLPHEAKKRGLPAVAGVLVTKVRTSTPADEAGIEIDDLIV